MYTVILAFLGLRGPQLIFVAVVVLLLFGAGRIPQIMRNLGKGVHAFKQGIEDAKEEINKEVTPSTPAKPAKDKEQ
ncbi:MAG: twin-arginine translocase TatA/TatE family subunit [Bacteroidales bacterium]|nr:twin-arginine translocase TatA/TatE family subunit [Bacteroidales bacterium]